jgi:hypothetical protein
MQAGRPGDLGASSSAADDDDVDAFTHACMGRKDAWMSASPREDYRVRVEGVFMRTL